MKLSPLPRPGKRKQAKFVPAEPKGDIIRMGEWAKLIDEVRRLETPAGFYSLGEYQKSLGGKETYTRKTLKFLARKKLAVMRILPGRSNGRHVPHWRINSTVLAALKAGKHIRE